MNINSVLFIWKFERGASPEKAIQTTAGKYRDFFLYERSPVKKIYEKAKTENVF